jgi:hypothetical protein
LIVEKFIMLPCFRKVAKFCKCVSRPGSWTLAFFSFIQLTTLCQEMSLVPLGMSLIHCLGSMPSCSKWTGNQPTLSFRVLHGRRSSAVYEGSFVLRMLFKPVLEIKSLLNARSSF